MYNHVSCSRTSTSNRNLSIENWSILFVIRRVPTLSSTIIITIVIIEVDTRIHDEYTAVTSTRPGWSVGWVRTTQQNKRFIRVWKLANFRCKQFDLIVVPYPRYGDTNLQLFDVDNCIILLSICQKLFHALKCDHVSCLSLRTEVFHLNLEQNRSVLYIFFLQGGECPSYVLDGSNYLACACMQPFEIGIRGQLSWQYQMQAIPTAVA